MRLNEMLQFDQATLDSYASYLEGGFPWAIQNIYDDITEKNDIPEGDERILFRELMPDLVTWFEIAMSREHPMWYMALDYVVYLIEHEELTALVPFAIRTLKANKSAVIKSLLILVKDAQGNVLSNETYANLAKFNLGWPELDMVAKSLAVSGKK